MTPDKFRTADEAAAAIRDGDTVALTGSGPVLVPDAVLAAIERRFLATGHPRDLTLVHALGIGDGKSRGLNHLAHEGLVRRVIGGHWSWSPRMQQLAREEKIEAYAFPAGVIGALLRESGARRPGLITRTGIGSFADPRQQGGRQNSSATEDLVRLIDIDGEEFLHYLPIKVDVAIVRGSTADANGNVAHDLEPAFLDSFAVALSAKGSKGLVICQAKRGVELGTLRPMDVHLPSTLIDLVVIDSAQEQTYYGEFNPAFNAAAVSKRPGNERDPHMLDIAKEIIVRRASREVRAGSIVNVGFGVSASVVDVLRREGRLSDITLAIEQGAIDGTPAPGALFGVSEYPHAIVSSTLQFDSFAAQLIDTAVLGMGELDVAANVNVSKLGGVSVGPGGFIDIVHGAKHSVFCGTFSTKGLQVSITNGRARIEHEGAIVKVVPGVEQITFAAAAARHEGRSAVFITERAVFELTAKGLRLAEIVPGLDPQRDVIDLLPEGVETEGWELMDAQILKDIEMQSSAGSLSS